MEDARRKQVGGYKIREIKSILNARGEGALAHGCVEKGDFVNAVLRNESFYGGLHCMKTGTQAFMEGGKDVVPDVIVLLCHGYGANANNLYPIGTQLCNSAQLKAKKVLFVLPNAPIQLDDSAHAHEGSFAWFPLNLQEFMMKFMTQGLESVFSGEELQGQQEARRSLSQCVQELSHKYNNFPLNKIILAGFSQGSWMAADTCFDLPSPPLALVLFSSAKISEKRWIPNVPKMKGLKVLQTHGSQDPVLPVKLGEIMRDFLKEHSLDVEYINFNGPHTVPEEGVRRLLGLIESGC